ncbi:MAG TPA: multiheme c-type cytochrome [Terriglobia bacterium]|nr:multiheme c-type cytochrome [Terriglobia bacterium]
MERQLNFGHVLVLSVVFLWCFCVSVARSVPAIGPVHPCAQCHPKEVAGYAKTQMAHSLGPATRVPSGKFTHAVSKTQFTIESDGSRMVQRVERGGVKGDYKIDYAVGSGTHAFAYLVELGDHLFESPIGYFPGRGWGMSPGFENSRAPDFDRPVTPDCLFCHSGGARPIAGTFNSYQNPPFAAQAITCERCHGPSEAHLRNPVPGSIINPANLPPRARDSVCEQCHLNGEERVANPGKQLADFRPGEDLEDVFSVYVDADSRDPTRPSPLKVISQVQQLALSTCARQSHGKLWCGTCHDPHVQPADPKSYFRARCLSCHGAALLQSHPKPNDDCIGCHMPRRPVSDGAHTIFTDHHIARRPAPSPGVVQPDKPRALVAWHEPQGDLAPRNLGIAEIRVGDRLESAELVSQGFQLLMDEWSKFPNDPAVLTALAKALLVAGHGAEAAALFEQAIRIEPDVALHDLHAGVARKAAHDNQKAAEYFEKAIQLDPLLEQPYLELAQIYGQAHDAARLDQIERRYLKAFPENLRARTASRRASAPAAR